ncbi:MAG: rhodanese-related sulfurtransferase [Proteobacteria bacterium]|nr:rhodanese-related sulfurtransferase [Pseudomonadota bacterium]
MSFIVAALYKFTDLPDFKNLQSILLKLGKEHNLTGSLLLAKEGINGTVAGHRAGIDSLKKFLKDDIRFDGIEYKESSASTNPFYRYKVRLKKEIVTLGEPSANPALKVGQYVEPKDWNALISDPNVLVIDTRNDYEVKIGTFKKALNPHTQSFREFPNFIRQNFKEKDKSSLKIALSCTGGIRTEKATSFLLNEGFKNVYHLKGGILRYLEEVPPQESLWEGECFVFDQRVGLKHGLEEGEHVLCYGCRQPLSPEDLKSPLYEPGVACPLCSLETPPSKKARAQARHKQVLLAKERGETHIGSSSKIT